MKQYSTEKLNEKYAGSKYGKLTVICFERRHVLKNQVAYIFRCQCECGNTKLIRLSHMQRGATNGCGCTRGKSRRKHGHSKSRIYIVWTSMKNRCLNPNAWNYKNYGGRGIKICDEWLNDANNFIDWAMSNGYEPGLQLDRVDNNGCYSPSNCRFVSNLVNSRNRRSNIKYTYNGQTKTISEWAEVYNIGSNTLALRLKKEGSTIEKSLLTPIKKSRTIKK